MLNKFLALFLLLFLTIAGQAAVWLPTASRAVEDATVTYDLFHADLKSKLVDTTELESGLSTKANSADVYTKAQSDATLEAYTYSETEINTALGGKADDVEGGTENNIITLNGSSEPKDSGVGISSVLTTSSSIEDLADVDPMILRPVRCLLMTMVDGLVKPRLLVAICTRPLMTRWMMAQSIQQGSWTLIIWEPCSCTLATVWKWMQKLCLL